MANLERVLKDEIRRLARAECKKETAVLRRSSAQYRTDIARLKRELTEAERRIAVLEGEVARHREQVVASPSGVSGRRFRPDGVRSLRKRLGLSAAELGALVGVTAGGVYQWETGNARPRPDAFAKLVELRDIGRREVRARLAAVKPSA